MKKACFVFLASFVLLTGCGSSAHSQKYSELSSQYDYYSKSASLIEKNMKISADEADDVFLILVDCGVASEINYVNKNADGTFAVWSSGNNYTVAMSDGVVSTVFRKKIFSDVQLYPELEEESSLPEETEIPEEDNTPEVPHRSGEEIVGVSDKDVSDIHMNFAGKVRNDVTEKWRYSTTSENIDIESYALSYYAEYFESDNEIHGIINFTRKTTARLNVSGNMIFLSLYDYVDGEEHDAKIMFSGTPLASYIIYTDNGDIEKID